MERATRLADEAVETKRLLETRARQPHDAHAPGAEIWDAAAREVVRAARERDRGLGIVGHELRQPLTAALAADRVLSTSSNPETLDRARTVISRQLAHLSQLVESMLDYSRLSLPGPCLRERRVDLLDLINDSIETVVASAVERRQDVALHHDGTRPMVFGDSVRLRQAVVNLLQNAIRYTAEGGHIRVSISIEAGCVSIAVRDTGEGIEHERLEAIYNPFVRGTASGPGLGIGLALVRRIAELHHGGVTAASDGPGTGSVFTLSLPAAQDGDER